MKKTSNHFVIVGFIAMILAFVSIISFYTLSMAEKSDETINSIGAIYMDGMNTEITRHFQTTIDLRLNQVNVIVENNDPDKFNSEKEMYEVLANEGKLRNFKYLAFLSSTGDIKMIYGSQIKIQDMDIFVDSLNNEENRVALAINAAGAKTMVLGVSASFPMEGNEECTALLAGVPLNTLDKIINSNENNSITFTSIIRKDGDYIIKNDNEQSDNYFSRIKRLYGDYGDKREVDYIYEVKDAINNNKSYSSIFLLGNERRHLFCSPLDKSEWYLITVMPYGELDEAIDKLNTQRTQMLVISLIVIVLTYTCIFVLYFRKTKKQINELNIARENAVKASKAKSDFLSNMSHDIRTPMNAIVGMTAVAASNIDNKPQLQNCLKKITQSNKQLLGLINDILDMSKIENGKMIIKREQVSLAELVSDIITVIQPQIKEKHQKLDVSVRNIITENVYSDNVRLNQVLMNIISNAIKFTADSGFISVLISQENSELGNNYVRVTFKIKDNGIGMSDEFKDKIFDSFAREDSKRVDKTEGTGLGMAITKYIVDAMNGKIEVDSEHGKGTEFRVIIDMEKADSEENTDDMVLDGWKVLIVDGNEKVCSNTASLLRKLGVEADIAADDTSAAEKAAERYASGDAYNAVLVDWRKDGTDNIKATRDIYIKTEKRIPIIVISAYDWSEVENEAAEAGVAGFIQKPLFISTFYNSMKAFGEKADSIEMMKSHKHKKYKGIRILVAEDNDINWEIINELMTQLGFKMEHAENGRACVDMFECSEPGYYSAIFMDIRMPFMDGYETTTAIRGLDREDAKKIPIIAMTANAFSDDIKSCLECGMNAHVAKPIEIQEVLRQLERYLNI